MNPKISVIIPVYNVEQHLRQCLNSVINQTLKEIEIILIDDGSTDLSLSICEEYKKKDSRISVLKQKNLGSGAARNKGIETANSEFVIFLDSDDYYPENDILETLYSNAKEHNVLICGGSFSILDNGQVTKCFEKEKTFDGYTFKKDSTIKYEDYQFDYGYHRFIYKLKFLKDNNIYFPDYKRFQDPPFFIKAMNEAGEFYALKKITYLLRCGHKAINWTTDKKEGLLNGISDNLNFAKEKNLSKLYYLTCERLNQHSYIFSEKDVFNSKFNKIIRSVDLTIPKRYNSNFKLSKNLLLKNQLLKFIFSLKNKDNHKILTILGIKLKFQLTLPEKDKHIYKNFVNHSVKDNSILMIEINGFHSETLPGMAKYFLDLGYNIDIILSEKEYGLDPLHRLRTENLSVYPMSAIAAKKILTEKIVNKYKLIYFNSDRFQDKSYFDFLKPNKKLTQKILNMCHRPDEYNSPIKKLMILAPLPLTNKEAFKVVNAHYFGKTINHNKAEITKFIVVGNIENKRKNHNLLYNAVEELVNKGITNFNITVIARCGELNIPENIRQFFDFKGSLNYPDMYDELEKADFFLTLLDPDNPEHNRYITTGSSGSFQLIYGFKKPCLIAEKFAALHGFNLQNSIVYQNNYDLTNAMQTAINMSNEQYHNLQINLAQYADTLYQESLANLKEILKCFQ